MFESNAMIGHNFVIVIVYGFLRVFLFYQYANAVAVP
jgi:hypothetical protein